MISILIQMLLIHGHPLEESVDNKVSVFNEVMVSCYLYFLIVLTDFNESNPFRIQIGFSLLATVFISILVNLLKTLLLVFGQVIRRNRIKKAKSKKYELNTISSTTAMV